MNLPKAFEERTKNILGDEYDDFAAALDQKQPVSIRLNPDKHPQDAQTPEEIVKWCESGFYLPSRPLFTIDPLIHAGCYYVQEASSMFLRQAVGQLLPNKPQKVLDLCAAPGGKSTLLAAFLPKGSLLVSNEYLYKRAYILAENIQKWGNPNCMVTCNAPKDFGKMMSMFDVVAVDAPCSGEGMFRKDDEAVTDWSLENVETCAQRQKAILEDVWPALKTGGIIIYSTCTYNREEDEQNAEFIKNLGAEPLNIKTEDDWNITKGTLGYHFFPHKTKGEGFYLCAFRKTSDERSCKIKNDKNQTKPSAEITQIKSWINNADNYAFDTTNTIVQLLPNQWKEEMLFLEKNLKTLYAGIPLGEQKGKNLLPAAALALSTELNPKHVNCADVELNTALQYLHTDNILLPHAPKGIVLIRYRNIPLGWVKNLGNRCNSLYPKQWRIRMNLPQEPNHNKII